MIIFGKQIVLYIVQNHPDQIEEFYFAKEIDKKIFSQLAKLQKPIIKLDTKKAQAMAHGGNHQGFLAKIKPIEPATITQLKKEPFIVVLAGMTDMGNIGSVIRSAYALGASGVIISGVREPKFETIIRASSGAALSLPIGVVFSTVDLLHELKQIGYKIVGATLDGVDIDNYQPSDKQVLVLGSEGEGFVKKVEEKFTHRVTIPMSKEFDSLNVSAAAAILIHSMKRKGQ
jgi:23S rRNA (guanosine2251-2'-O)-methyltransferase